ncbi:Protein CLEC16A like [Schistosoma japonicum]|nr:Protein CLEC16A like [Schistosoma japonicum]
MSPDHDQTSRIYSRMILVEALRLIAEILIWGDQNDSSVMDFFLEKNILEYFLQFMKQDSSRRICVQLLQTLNILFENITNQTAICKRAFVFRSKMFFIDYLLSNNHTNAIITHRFDFTDEEVMAYYISFLKILSFRLNINTISFFYIESRREFDLYVEAIKLFAHPESMVRIAVRTITLNVHKVKDEASLEFIHHQTSLSYFSHLVWSIGNTILDIDCYKYHTKAKDLVAEHIDHLHYIDDLLSLDIEGLNEVLCDQLLRRVFLPLHIYSLFKQFKSDTTSSTAAIRRPRLSYSVTVFTLIHVYLFLRYTRLISLLTEAILIGDFTLPGLIIPYHMPCSNSQILFNDSTTTQDCFVNVQRNLDPDETDDVNSFDGDPAVFIAKTLIAATVSLRAADQALPGRRLPAYLTHSVTSKNPLGFFQPSESLEHGLIKAKGVTPTLMSVLWPPNMAPLKLVGKNSATCNQPMSFSNPCENSSSSQLSDNSQIKSSCSYTDSCIDESSFDTSVKSKDSSSSSSLSSPKLPNISKRNDKKIDSEISNLSGRVFLRSLFRSLEIGSDSDQDALFSILLLIAIKSNKGIDSSTLKLAQLNGPQMENEPSYNYTLATKLIELISDACKAESCIRLITVRMAICLLTDLVYNANCGCKLSDQHFAEIINAREQAMLVLRGYFEINAIFLDMFENELRRVQLALPSLSTLATDARLLTQPYSSFSGKPKEVTKNTTTTTTSSSSSTSKIQMLTCDDMDLIYRLPSNEQEHIQRAIGVYLIIHIWLEKMFSFKIIATSSSKDNISTDDSLTLNNSKLPSIDALFSNLISIPGLGGFCNIPDSKSTAPVLKMGDRLDLFSETLIGCTVESSGIHEKRFIVSCGQQLVLVKPDSKQLGWGVITFIGPLQDLESHCDPTDSRCLHVTIHAPGHLTCRNSSPGQLIGNNNNNNKSPIMVAKFLFQDHIRCMTARQLLSRGKTVVEQTKLRKIASLLDFPPQFIREKFLTNNTTTCYISSSSGIVGSKNYMCNSQYTMSATNRFDPVNSLGMYSISGNSSRRVGTNTITETTASSGRSPPPDPIKRLANEISDDNEVSSCSASESVHSGNSVVVQHTYGETDATTSIGLEVPLICLANLSTSTTTIITATLKSNVTTSQSPLTKIRTSTVTPKESIVKSHSILFKTPTDRTLNQQEFSQLTTPLSLIPKVDDERITSLDDEESKQTKQEQEETDDEKKKPISLFQVLPDLQSNILIHDYLSREKQAEHNCLLSSKSNQLDYSSSDISDV